MDHALSVTGLRKAYGSNRAVDGLTFSAAAGRITAVLGPNGAGKTTMLECCEGLREPDAGEIVVLGRTRRTPSDDQWLRERVGVMVQQGGLPMAPTPRQVLGHVAAFYRTPADRDHLVTALSLEDALDTSIRRLSGGQRQRVAVACALVGTPELAFLDEPSSGVDPHARRESWALLREQRDRGCAIVLTTHHLAEAEELADHVIVMDRGRVVAAGTVDELASGTRLALTGLGDPARAAAVVARWGSPAVSPDGAVTAVVDRSDVRFAQELTAALDTAGEGAASLTLARRTLESVYLSIVRESA
ncbi:MAG: ABC transporter ATP-binding protein [Actinomycetota bacterium]